ncbi:uncharacterized protein GBIM_10296 [Gryllus bimaculatus]|nr:uncharacterized protein GBIM_10296 [Gryllus bimaculatus]
MHDAPRRPVLSQEHESSNSTTRRQQHTEQKTTARLSTFHMAAPSIAARFICLFAALVVPPVAPTAFLCGKEAGIRTLVALDDQEEQLERIEKGMDEINADMKEAAKSLAAMAKCCGICDLSCNKSSSSKEDDAVWKGDDDSKVVQNQPQRVMDPNCMGPQTGYIGKITNDAREQEMEENMEEVSAMVGNMRNMALDIGNALSNQEVLINRIQRKADSNVHSVAEANEKAHALLK